MSRNPWNNRHDSNPYYSQPPQPVPPPAPFTIGGSKPYHSSPQPQPVPPPSGARPAVFGKPVQDYRGLPDSLIDRQGTIVIFQPLLQCGILRVTSGTPKPVYCFFQTSQVCATGSVQLRSGVRMMTSARLVTPAAKVPYLATCVWGEGQMVNQGWKEASYQAPFLPETLEKYHNLSEDLSFELDDPRNMESHGRQGYEERKRVASPDRQSRHSSSSSYQGEEFGKKRRHDRSPSPTVRDVTIRSQAVDTGIITEQFPEFGVSGVVDRYLSHTTGVISVRNGDRRKVLFHVNQVWMPRTDGTESSPFLEVHPLQNLSKLVEVGQELKLNARRISGCKFNLQATAVWRRQDPPANYKTEELLQNLNLTLNQHIFFETGDSLYKTNPLAGTPDFTVSAKVQEYFSFEMGFLKLDSGDRGVVLFHLNQIWTKGNGSVPYRIVQDISLPEYLPIGSSVMVNMRKLQVSQSSSLKYQATLVWPSSIAEEPTGKLLPEYLSMYGPHEERVKLVNQLNDHHDSMKRILGMSMSSYASDFVPVHAVLNGLPNFWEAQVVEIVNDDYGIIRIYHSEGLELAPRVQSMFVLFHIEDVFDANGLPAIKSSNVSMPALLNSHVDLTARPICQESEPDKILDLQRTLNEGNVDPGTMPILQAIIVCVKMHPDSDIEFAGIPKPTPLRDHPGCFGSSVTEFYLDPTLKSKLTEKLYKFLDIPNRPVMPHRKKILRNCKMDQNLILSDLNKVDSNKTAKFLYGEFPEGMESLQRPIPGSLPRRINNHAVRLKYLHRHKFKSEVGVVEICINPHGSAKERIITYASFSLHRYKFFTPKDCFASNLVNFMPIYSKENFSVTAELAFPESKIPYVVLAIWNENLRKEMNVVFPQTTDLDSKRDRRYLNSCSELIAQICPAEDRQASEGSRTIPIPPNVGRVNKGVKEIDISKVIMDGDNLVEKLENMNGIVESVLSEHSAIVTVKQKFSDVKYRVLCSSDDVFDLKHILPKFSYGSEVWKYTARSSRESLHRLLKPGQKVKLNAVPLLAYPNPADVHYVSSGVLVGKHSLEQPVPVHCIKTSAVVNNAWKTFFGKLVRSMNNNGEYRQNAYTEHVPGKFQDHLKKGTTGLMELREEYRRQDMRGLPVPVRSKQKVPKTVVWKDILNDHYGQVIRIMDKNYGIAAGFVLHGSRAGSPEFLPFQIVFDTFDVFIGDYDCNELGKTLADVMKVGDFIKFNGVRVDPAKTGDARDIRYMATALVVAKTSEKVKCLKFPADIAQIDAIDQVTPTKIDNFKVVAGVMNGTRLSEAERELLDSIKSGKLASKVMDLSHLRYCADDVLQESDESTDEATCVEDYRERKNVEKLEPKEETFTNIETLVGELKPKELRKLLMSYIEVVNKQPDGTTKKGIDVAAIGKSLNIGKDVGFLEEFFISLGNTCKTAEKGIKVGHVFITQTQVKAIRLKGISCKEDIEIGDAIDKFKVDRGRNSNVSVETNSSPDDELKVDKNHNPNVIVGTKSSTGDVLSQFSTPVLRKFILSFMKLIDKSTTLEEIAKDSSLSVDVVKDIFKAISNKCKGTQVVDGKRQSFKLQNIFMNSTWIEKIVLFNF